DVSVGNLASGPDVNSNALVAQIDNRGGNIGGNALVNFGASGNVDAQGNAIFQVLNYNDGTSGPGSIGGKATINLYVGGNLNTTQGGFLNLQIANSDGGHIAGDASILASITGNLNTTDLNFGIQDYNGGVIMGGGNVTLNVGGSLTNGENTHPLFLFVNT